MTNAYRKYFPTDDAPAVLRDYVKDVNTKNFSITIDFGTIEAAGNKPDKVMKLAVIANDDMVINGALLNVEIPFASADDIICVETHTTWSTSTVPMSGVHKLELADFSINNIPAFIMVDLLQQLGEKREVGFPFVVNKGEFVTVYIVNGGKDPIHPVVTLTAALLKDHVVMPPSVPESHLSKMTWAS